MFDPSRLAALIESQRGHCIEFGSGEDGPSDRWIRKAEQKLKWPLPPSYRWFLQEYGGGEISGNEIYSIYEEDFDEVAGGDVVAQYLAHQATKTLQADEIPIMATDFGEVYAFKATKASSDGEYPVLLIRGKTKELYADDFAEFLTKIIAEFCS